MPSEKQPTAHENFRTGVALCQAHRNMVTTKDAAEFLGITYMSLVKIMDGSQKPTIDQITTLCKREGLSANWLLLNEGSPYQREQVQLSDVMKELKALRSQLSNELQPG